MNVAQQRLRTQRLAGPGFASPADVVRWFGAIQAQDYAGALWAVGMRTTGATEAPVEPALIDRAIVRTWPLRGTLHVVAAGDCPVDDDLPRAGDRQARRDAVQAARARRAHVRPELGRLEAREARALADAVEGYRAFRRPASSA